MPDTYDHITLMCRLKAAQRRNKELESGERYIQLKELHQKEYNVYEHKIEKLKKELADAHKETIRALNAEKQRDNALDKAAVFRSGINMIKVDMAHLATSAYRLPLWESPVGILMITIGTRIRSHIDRFRLSPPDITPKMTI